MNKIHIKPFTRRLRLFSQVSALVSGLFLAGLPSASATPLDEIHMTFQFKNDFAAGYDKKRHTYTDDFIEDVLKKPTHRGVRASICDSLPMFVPEAIHQAIDNKKAIPTCGPAKAVRSGPDGTDTMTWELKGPHPITKERVVLDSRIDKVLPIPEPVNSECTLSHSESERILSEAGACQIDFAVPVPKHVLKAPTYTIDLTFRDKNKNILIGAQSKSFTIPQKIPLIVSIGDSYASGEGNPDSAGDADDFEGLDDVHNQRDCEDDTTVMYINDTKPRMLREPEWLEPRDHRSLRSAHALAARSLLDEWPHVNFLSFAKSGAKISSPDENDLLEQLEHVAKVVGKQQKIDALIMTIGGNDAGFASGIANLTEDFTGNASRDEVLSDFLESFLRLREKFSSISDRIRKLELDIGAVLITEYPQSLFEDKNGQPREGCGLFRTSFDVDISTADAEAISRMAKVLNAEIKLAAERNNWIFVDGIVDGFAGHGYCSGQSFFRFAEDSCDMQGDFKGVLHPNPEGQKVYAREIARELRKVLATPGPIVVKP